MQRFPHKPRRPKAKAAAIRPPGTPPTASGNWADLLSRALITALGLFIAVQLILALPGRQPGIAAVGDHIVINAASARLNSDGPIITGFQAGSAAPRRCQLDIAAMKHPGGVLTVLQTGPAGILLSWAGGATVAGAAACHSRNITIRAIDYVTLLNTAAQNIIAR